MIDWIKRVFAAEPSSSSTAKDRLRLVLMTDHLALAPEIIEQMKRDLVEVISRYVEVDREKVEVNFEREDKALAMLANIPITGVNRPGGGEPAEAAPAAAAPTPQAAAPTIMAAPRVASPGAEAAVVAAAAAAPAPVAPPSRKRRKRKGHATSPPPPTSRTSPAF